jgi:hypothetical protein
MSVNLRYPNITQGSEKEQIAQIKRYLHQLVEQLNYALPSAGAGEGAAQTPSTFEVQGGEMSYYDLRSLIIQEVNEIEHTFDQLSAKMQSEYVSDAEMPQIVEETLAQAKASGAFDGEDGYTPQKGVDYFDGEDGYTPKKGVDYFTEAEITNVAKQAAGKITFTLDEEGNLYYEVEE